MPRERNLQAPPLESSPKHVYITQAYWDQQLPRTTIRISHRHRQVTYLKSILPLKVSSLLHPSKNCGTIWFYLPLYINIHHCQSSTITYAYRYHQSILSVSTKSNPKIHTTMVNKKVTAENAPLSPRELELVAKAFTCLVNPQVSTYCVTLLNLYFVTSFKPVNQACPP